MNKVLGIIMCVLLLLVPGVLAESQKTVVDGWYRYSDSFSAGGNTYTIRGANTDLSDDRKDEIFVVIKKNDGTGIHVFLEDCQETETYTYCFEDRSFTRNEIDIDYKGQVQPALKIKLLETTYSNSASITRTFEKTSLYWGEESEVTITVTNNGDFSHLVTLEEPVPEGFVITEKANVFTQDGNTLKANFAVISGDTWSATYTIKAQTYESKKYKTFMNYEVVNSDKLNETKGAYSSEATLSIKTPYKLTAKLASNAVDIEDNQELTITIENTEDTEIVVKEILFRVPATMNTIVPSNLAYQSAYSYTRKNIDIAPGKSVTFSLKGKVPFVGEYTIMYEGEIEGKIDTYPFSGSYNFTTTTKGMYCSITAPENSRFEATVPFTVQVEVGNTDDKTYYAIQGQTQDREEASLDRLAPTVKQIIFEKEIVPEFSLDKQELLFTFEGTYATEVGQEFPLRCEKSFTITEGEQLFTARTSMETTTARRNETATFTLVIENAPVAVSPVIITVGDQERLTSIAPGEIVEEIFTIIIPEYEEQEEFVQEISLKTLDEYAIETSATFTIENPYDWEEEYDALVTDTDEGEQENEVRIIAKNTNNDDTSFFGKIKTFFREFFS